MHKEIISVEINPPIEGVKLKYSLRTGGAEKYHFESLQQFLFSTLIFGGTIFGKQY